MKIELTTVQLDKVIQAVNEKFLKDPKNGALWLGLQHNLENQREKQNNKKKKHETR